MGAVQASARSPKSLLGHARFCFAIGCQNLKVMNAGSQRMFTGPHNFLVGCNLNHGDSLLRAVAADYGVSIGQPLCTAGIMEQSIDIVVGYFPNDGTVLVEFDHFIAMR